MERSSATWKINEKCKTAVPFQHGDAGNKKPPTGAGYKQPSWAATQSQLQYNVAPRHQLAPTSASVYGAGPVATTSRQVHASNSRHSDDKISDDEDSVDEENLANNQIQGRWREDVHSRGTGTFRRQRNAPESANGSKFKTVPSLSLPAVNHRPGLPTHLREAHRHVPDIVVGDEESFLTPPEEIAANKNARSRNRNQGVRFSSPLLTEPQTMKANKTCDNKNTNKSESQSKRPTNLMAPRSQSGNSSSTYGSNFSQIVPDGSNNERMAKTGTLSIQNGEAKASVIDRPGRSSCYGNQSYDVIPTKTAQEKKVEGRQKEQKVPSVGENDADDTIRIAESASVIRIVRPQQAQPQQKMKPAVVPSVAKKDEQNDAPKPAKKSVKDSATTTHDLPRVEMIGVGTNTSFQCADEPVRSQLVPKTCKKKIGPSTDLMSPDEGLEVGAIENFEDNADFANRQPSNFSSIGTEPQTKINSGFESVYGINKPPKHDGISDGEKLSKPDKKCDSEKGAKMSPDEGLELCEEDSKFSNEEAKRKSDNCYPAQCQELPAVTVQGSSDPFVAKEANLDPAGNKDDKKKGPFVCGRPFRGGICGRLFKTRKEWKKHEEVHHHPEARACPPCWCVSTSAQWISRHLREGCLSGVGRPPPPAYQQFLDEPPAVGETGARRSPRLQAKMTPLK